MHPDDALNDAALERELDRALAVDPSPEFVPRVRTHIANGPARAPWRTSWMFALGAGAAIVVVAIVVQLSNPATNSEHAGRAAPVADTPLLAARIVADPSAGTLPTTEPYIQSYVVSAFVRESHVASAFRWTSPEPETLIDPREAIALRQLIDGVWSGRVDLRPVLRASTPTAMDLPPVDDIVIPLITIEPLAPATGAEGVRQ